MCRATAPCTLDGIERKGREYVVFVSVCVAVGVDQCIPVVMLFDEVRKRGAARALQLFNLPKQVTWCLRQCCHLLSDLQKLILQHNQMHNRHYWHLA